MDTIPAKITKKLVIEMDKLIDDGWYANRSEFIRDAIRDTIKKNKIERLEEAIKEDVEWGLEEINLENQNSRLIKKIRIVKLSKNFKDISKIISEKYSLGLGESQVIALAKKENTGIIFTDDLDARTVAKSLGFEVHGTIGLVLRTYREKIVSKNRAISVINDLNEKSTLFLTSELTRYILNEIDKS